MSLELLKNKIVFDQKIGKEKTQVLLEGDIIVPDIKPDVSLVLKIGGKVKQSEVEVIEGKVSFIGELLVNILYLSKDTMKPVHGMSTSLPIRDVIYMDEVTKDTSVKLNYALSHMEYRLVNDRKLSLKAIVTLNIKALNEVSKEIVVDFSEGNTENADMQFVKKPLLVARTIDSDENSFIIKDELSIPQGNPNIKEILKLDAKINDKEIRVQNGKVNVKGTILINTLYIGDTDDSFIELTEHEIPFNGAVEVKNAVDDATCDVSLLIDNEYCQIRADADGEDRVIDVEFTIAAKSSVTAMTEMQMIVDAYSISKDVKLVNDSVYYPKLVCQNKNQCSIKETIKLDAKCPPIMQVFETTGDPVVDDVTVENDKILVDGYIPTDILYVAKSDETPIYCYCSTIPFSHFIDAKGAKPKMDVNIDTFVEHISYNMLSDSEVEVRYIIKFNCAVFDDEKTELVTDIIVNEADENYLDLMPSIVIYVVEEGDSLWKIAKKYHTCIAEIAKLNDIENVDKIYPGQKLMILKKIVED